MNVEEIITVTKNTTMRYTFLMFGVIFGTAILGGLGISFITSFETKPAQAIGALVIIVLTAALLFGGISFVYSKNVVPGTKTRANIGKVFDLDYHNTIQGDLNSTRDQTIIFTGVKNNEYSNFTAIVKDGIFTLTQHDPANTVSLAPVNK